jgi:hypothetical protein
MATTDRVCPFCGEPPGPGVFCAACGRNLAAVDRLPTREEWAAGAVLAPAEGAARSAGAADRPLAERCAEATAAFLAAMRAAGDPGTTTLPMPEAKQGVFRRTPEARGWVVRPVVWDDRDAPKHHEPGLFLTTDGTFHRIDSQIRGWGQRSFPVFHDTVGADALDPPADERLIVGLEALLREHGVAAGAGYSW